MRQFRNWKIWNFCIAIYAIVSSISKWKIKKIMRQFRNWKIWNFCIAIYAIVSSISKS